MLAHGFHASPVAGGLVRGLLWGSLILFVLSRAVLLIGPERTGHLRRWWLDYALMAGASVWAAIHPPAQATVLALGPGYVLAAGFGTLALRVLRGLCAGGCWGEHPLPRLLVVALAATALGGFILSLPVCWNGPYPITWPESYPGAFRIESARHARNCLFTAAGALTGTGLRLTEPGRDFTRAGQTAILVLMQLGGMAMVAAGTIVGFRFRRLIGWGGAAVEVDPARMRRAVIGVWIAMVVLEGIAALGIHALMSSGGVWEPSATASSPGTLPAAAPDGNAAGFRAVFLAVSAFCNVGWVVEGARPAAEGFAGLPVSVYGIVLPLMVLGSLGGPVLYDLGGLLRRRGGGRRLTPATGVVLAMTVLLVLSGAGLLMLIESTPAWQLRYPRGDTPGRALLKPEPEKEMMVFATTAAADAGNRRFREMAPGERWLAAVVTSVSARGGAFGAARLEEGAISPASRLVLMAGMMIGGALGGTAGGIHLLVLALLVRRMWRSRGADSTHAERPAGAPAATEAGAPGRGLPASPVEASGGQAGRAAAGAVLSGMVALIALMSLAVLYREPGSLEASVFEVISACCSAGLSSGITPQFSPFGHVALMFAMLCGRVLPVAVLAANLRRADGGFSRIDLSPDASAPT